jgi:hypothetical protein
MVSMTEGDSLIRRKVGCHRTPEYTRYKEHARLPVDFVDVID